MNRATDCRFADRERVTDNELVRSGGIKTQCN